MKVDRSRLVVGAFAGPAIHPVAAAPQAKAQPPAHPMRPTSAQRYYHRRHYRPYYRSYYLAPYYYRPYPITRQRRFHSASGLVILAVSDRRS